MLTGFLQTADLSFFPGITERAQSQQQDLCMQARGRPAELSSESGGQRREQSGQRHQRRQQVHTARVAVAAALFG